MVECPIYFIDPNSLLGEVSEPIDDTPICQGSCNCGYIQYEGLIPYLKEIQSSYKNDEESRLQFEFKLREQIVEISRLFDMDANVEPGFFSKAHYQTTKIFPTYGTKYIKVPDFVSNTLEIRRLDNTLLDDSSYGFQDGFLVYLPCITHQGCGCGNGCGEVKSVVPIKWPKSCYKITARWGKECADMAVQKAVRDYLIESYRILDPLIQSNMGIPFERKFQVPHSWNTYVRSFKSKKAIFSEFAIA